MDTKNSIRRVILLILDSLGIGAAPDAGDYGDAGSNTLLHMAAARDKGLHLPALCSLGLGRLVKEIGCRDSALQGCYGRMVERSCGKDTTTGHWELCGLVRDTPFPTYPKGFPSDIIIAFETAAGCTILGNRPASGTRIIEELGPQHLRNGQPIVYTSADSVFQIAAHEKVIPTEELYDLCRTARDLLTGAHAVARVIARPFRGEPGAFERINGARKDFSLAPAEATLLDRLVAANRFVCGVGKIGDIFCHQGLTEEVHTGSNEEGVTATIAAMETFRDRRGLIFTNLVDFDMVYGHRRDAQGYARALEDFDHHLPTIIDLLAPDDLLVITADHGCDPTHLAHTDHTRETVPLLVAGPRLKSGVDLGRRTTFADCGATIADLLGCAPLANGTSFKGDILP